MKALQWPTDPTFYALHTLTSFSTPLFSSYTSQMTSLMFLKCTRHIPSMEPLHMLLVLPKNTFSLFFCTACDLTSFRFLLKYYLPNESFPDGYDIATLISYQVFFSILLTPCIYNIFMYSFIYCQLYFKI